MILPSPSPSLDPAQSPPCSGQVGPPSGGGGAARRACVRVDARSLTSIASKKRQTFNVLTIRPRCRSGARIAAPPFDAILDQERPEIGRSVAQAYGRAAGPRLMSARRQSGISTNILWAPDEGHLLTISVDPPLGRA